MKEFKKIATIATNWVKIDTKDDDGEFIRVLMIRESAGATRSLYCYVNENFFGKTEEELQAYKCWNDIKDYDWQFRDKAIEMLKKGESGRWARVDLSTIALPK